MKYQTYGGEPEKISSIIARIMAKLEAGIPLEPYRGESDEDTGEDENDTYRSSIYE